MKKFNSRLYKIEEKDEREEYEDLMSRILNAAGKMTLIRCDLVKKHHKETSGPTDSSEWDEFCRLVEWEEVIKEEDIGDVPLPA